MYKRQAENGAIWIPQEVKYKALYFISERLVILIDRNKICLLYTSIEQFCAVSRAVGGTAVVLGEGEDVNAVIRRNYPDAMRIASVLPDISSTFR